MWAVCLYLRVLGSLKDRVSFVQPRVNHCYLEWMCLLVSVFLHHRVSIHIRSYGRIKWHCWRYMAGRSGYIFIYSWQLVICSCAHLTCVCVWVWNTECVCMHAYTRSRGVNGEWRDFNSSWSTVRVSHVVISVSVCVCAYGRERKRIDGVIDCKCGEKANLYW